MAMVKTVTQSGWDWDAPAAALFKLGVDGRLGPGDRREFVKRAGSAGPDLFADALPRIKWAKDEIPVHVIALGAKEAYGANRNGDAFTEAMLKAHHDTFVKYAYWFRNHKNKKAQGDPTYGNVKASAYNTSMRRVELLVGLPATEKAAKALGVDFMADKELEKIAKNDPIAVSMACPRLGTLVKLKRGFRKVEDIKPGDEVLTHRGRYKPVYATLRRVKRQYAKIATRYCGRQVLEFTPEHEFFVARWKDYAAAAGSKRTSFDRMYRKKHRDQLHAHAKWVPCGDLEAGDMLLMPIYRGTGDSPITVEQARLLGYYVAEGSITSDDYLCLTCNKADVVVDEMLTLAGNASYGVQPHSASEEAVNVTLYDKSVARAVSACVGRGVRNKVIPAAICDAPTEMKLEFLAAWFNGDGWQDGKGLHWSTCSRTLSVELQTLLASVGIPASVYRIDHTSDLPDRPRTGDGIEYTVNVSNRYSSAFAGRSKAEAVELQAEKTTVFITGDYLAIPVKSVEVVEEEVEVCDLSVEDDESFTAYGFAVHNCRVPYDVCSACDNKARTRDEYCKEASCPAGGCFENLTRLVKLAGDLHQLHVENPNPVFFDISNVFRPADRIAYGGKADWIKAACDLGMIGFGGVKVAEALMLEAPVRVAAEQDAADASPAVAAQVKLAYALPAVDTASPISAAFSPGVRAAFDFNTLSVDVDSPEKRASLLGALALEKIVLPLAAFAAMTKRAELAPEAAEVLPNVFDKMAKEGSVVGRLSANKYTPGDSRSFLVHRRIAADLYPDYSLDKEAVNRRCQVAAVRGLTAKQIPPSAKTGFSGPSKSAGAENLARDYACYQVAALHKIAEFDQEFPLTVLTALCQNACI